MSAIRIFLFNILFFALTFAIACAAAFVSLFRWTGGLRWLLRRWGRMVYWLAVIVLGARIEIRGLENLPANGRPPIIASKHQSELDVIFPLYMWSDLAAVAMRELDNYPLVGRIVTALDYIKVTTEGPRQNQLPEVIEGSRRAHAQGRPILIYPEGELMNIGARERYKSGVFHIYDAIQQPVTPVALSCGLVWPKRDWRKFIGQRCVVEFLPPIPPGMDKETFMPLIEETIENATMALLREHAPPERLARAEQRFLERANNAAG